MHLSSVDSTFTQGILLPNRSIRPECLHFPSFRPQYLSWEYIEEQQPGVGLFVFDSV
jgi:hypothetical protein